MANKKTPIVKTDTVVEVGKTYYVRCALRRNEWGGKYFVPIIGELHNDKNFGIDAFHYHIDGRFCTRKQMEIHGVCNEGKTNYIIREPHDQYYELWLTYKIAYIRMVCRRTGTGLNIKWEEKGKANSIFKRYFRWYDSMVGKSCAGKRCPHLGYTMKEEGGQLVCPLHNLKGDIKTEKIIPIC